MSKCVSVSVKMSKLSQFAVLLIAISATQAEQSWYSFQTTWAALPFQGFFNQPRTLEEAMNAGYTQVSNDCTGASE